MWCQEAPEPDLASGAIPEVRYAVVPVPGDDRTTLVVELQLRGDSDGRTRLGLPSNRYGVPDMREAIVGLRCDKAQVVSVPGEADQREVVHEPTAELRIRYEVDWDPDRHLNSAYRPEVGPDHFQFFGSQWRIELPDHEGTLRYTVEVLDVPEGWTVFGNLGAGPGPWTVESGDEELSAFLAGGEFGCTSFLSGSTPVSIHVGGQLPNRQDVLASAWSAVGLFGERLGVLETPFYVVSVTGRGRARAGVAIDHAFVCFVPPDIGAESLLRLLAHETLHNWIPGQATIAEWSAGEGADEYRLDWIVEGLTEYWMRVSLREAELISEADFVEVFHQDLEELERNPLRGASLEHVARAIRAGAYSNRHERLNYNRGPLLGLRWERHQTANGGPSVDAVLREFVELARSKGGELAEAEFFDLFESHGIPARGDYQRHVVEGRPIIPDEDAFGAGYRLVTETVEVRDPGFDEFLSEAEGRLAGIRPDGAAYGAGLRENQVLLELSEAEEGFLRVRVRDEAEGEREVLLRPFAKVERHRYVQR